MLKLDVAALILTAVLATSSIANGQQGGTTIYVYDDDGRLTAVISPNGEASTYEYDAAGNFTRIRHLGADSLEVLSFKPTSGSGGDLVTLIGVGFGANGLAVSFNGVSAKVLQQAPSTIVVEVPDDGSTGPITVTTVRGSAVTTKPFTFIPNVKVNPTNPSLLVGSALQFMARPSGVGSNKTVMWSVNGVNGGNSALGTISATGLYTAPALFFAPIIIRATSVANPTVFGETSVNLQNPGDASRSPFAAVSVARANPVDLQPKVGPIAALSVMRETAEAQNIVRPSSSVSATKGPNITAVTPASLTRGTTVTVTIAGTNFDGATAVNFYDSNSALDANSTAANLVVGSGGTSVTATVTVKTNAAIGQRFVVVVNATGQSLFAKVPANTIAIQ